MIKFFKGASDKYNAQTHSDGIFFTTDTDEILVNSDSYGKNADKSLTTSDIVVAGGPLADDITNDWPTEWVKDGNKVIPSGTSIQDILQGLFLKTVPGTVEWGSKSWSPSLGKPTVELSSNGPAEIGSTVTCKVVSNSKVSGNTRSCTCTASQGHFTSLDGSWVSGNKTVSKTGTTSGSVSLSYTWNGEAVSNFASESTTLKIKDGENKFVANQSGIKASVEALPTTTVYASTNTKSILTDTTASKKQVATMSDTKPNDEDLTSTQNDTITGSYRYFIGQVSGTGLTYDSDLVRGLSTKGFVSQLTTADVMANVAVSAGGNTFVIAVPEEYTITNLLALGDDAKGAFMTDGAEKTTVDVVLPDNSTKKYNVFYCENVGGADAKFTNLKIGVKS